MTTLQLARLIATRVIQAYQRKGRRRRSAYDAPTQAVLQALERTDSWFCYLPPSGALSRMRVRTPVRRDRLKDPVSRAEWQEAVDLASVCLLINDARLYGLIVAEISIDTDRCREILELGRAIGVTPREDAIDRVLSVGGAP